MNIITDFSIGLLISFGAAAVVEATPVTSEAEAWLKLIERFGIMAVILLYFIGRDWLRARNEKRERIHEREYKEKLESYVRDALVNELQLTRHALTKNSYFLKRSAEASSKCPGFKREKSDEESDLHPIEQLDPPTDGESNVQKLTPSGHRIAV